ncbi:MAG: DUF2461 domain-containing protein, partial [Paracoccaceae bacterium]|nr:DUF2461 domain-containing protein [Paracoccaceae bacterium]
MSFPGIPPETPRFLADLAAHNRKDWFEANRGRYEAHWRDVGLSLVEALQPFCAKATPRLEAVPKIGGALRRIHRDIRFSADKSPYAPMLHVVLSPVAASDRHTGVHVVLHPDRVGFGAGQYGLSPEALARFRNRVTDRADRARLLEAAEAARAGGSDWDEPDLKRLPKGFEAGPDWEHLLRRKSVILRGETPGLPAWLSTPRCLAEIERLAEA